MTKFGTVTDSAGADAVATELVDLVKSVGIAALTVGGGSEALCALLNDRKSPGPCEAALKGLTALCKGEPALSEAVAIGTLSAQLPCLADRADSVKEATLALVSYKSPPAGFPRVSPRAHHGTAGRGAPNKHRIVAPRPSRRAPAAARPLPAATRGRAVKATHAYA